MFVKFQKDFKKDLKKLSKKSQERFFERLDVFVANPFHPVLNNHQLHGKLKSRRSINITGDIRAIYEQIDNNTVVFLIIAKHSELYD